MTHKMRLTFMYLFSNAVRNRPSYLIVYILDIVVKAVTPFVNIIFPKYLIGELLGEARLRYIVCYISCIAIGNFAGNFLANLLLEKLNKNYYDDFSKYFDALFAKKNMQIPYIRTEDKVVLKKAQKARDGLGIQSGGIGGIASCLSQVITNIIVFVGAAGLLLPNAPYVFPIVTVGVMAIIFLNKRVNDIQISYFEKMSENNRGNEYVLYNLTAVRYGKDIRLYHAQDMMICQADKFNQNMAYIGKKQARDVIPWYEASKVIIAIREGSTFLYLGFLGIKRIIQISDFMMLVNASNALGNSLNTVIIQLQEIVKRTLFAYQFVEFMQMDVEELNDGINVEKEKMHSIEFRNVSFTYPGTNKKALDNVSVVIKAGEKISIVGSNGAGKTTFIKLLCRLYKVDSGEILLDGTNINEYLLEDYLKTISVVFQDFMLLGFSLKENVALSDSKKISDNEVMQLFSRVGLKDKILSLPMKMQTPVFRYYDLNGFEPSGGEQQKIAIARAIYKNGGIMILDEPTAALDPISEAEIYEKFNDMTFTKTAVFISHRLSSCRFCDRILVFDKGKIIENGTHQSLLKHENGLYANMYQTQAQYYQYR